MMAVADTSMSLTVADLSADQRVCYDAVLAWLRDRGLGEQTLTLSGFAGTGKSTVVSLLAREVMQLGTIAFCAFTGKAASGLARKLARSGIETVNKLTPREGGWLFESRPFCGTIHALVFRPCELCTRFERAHTYGLQCRLLEAVNDNASVNSNAVANDNAAANDNGLCRACDPPPILRPCPACRDTGVLRRARLDRSYALIVVDEASMVSNDILRALLSFGVPILAVGDHGQLPPIDGAGALMRNPTLKLEKIHRQHHTNPIIALSERVRLTGELDPALQDGEHFVIRPRRELDAWIAQRFPRERLATGDILGTVIVTGRNSTRCHVNRLVHRALGCKGTPEKGEVVICLKNKPPIYNGMRGVLIADATRMPGRSPRWKASIHFVEDGEALKEVTLAHGQFFREKTLTHEDVPSLRDAGDLYDFGYALTCHKMQGAQAPEVAVVMELFGGAEERARWIYTAATRAEKKLVIFR